MCPEVIFTSGAFQVNYCKETACKVHKKVSPDFCTAPVEETCFAAALEHRHDEKTINNGPNWQYLSFFKTVPRWKGLPSSGSPGGQRILGVQGWAPCIPPSCMGFACCICKLFHDQTLQLHANVRQCINVIPAMLRMCLTNREKPKPHGVWFMPVTGWTCWQTLEAAPPKSVEMDESLR